MILSFEKATARSSDDLLDDLMACRALRHVVKSEKQAVVRFFFGGIEHSLLEGKKLPGTGRYFVWTQEAFEEAFSAYGYACDTCGAVSAVPEKEWRRCAQRALDNLDGQVRLMLCRLCSRRFSTFCMRTFKREVRVEWSRDLEKMMLAFIANEVRSAARRVMAGQKVRSNEQTARRDDRDDRNPLAGWCDSPRDRAPHGHQQEHRREISEGLRQ